MYVSVCAGQIESKLWYIGLWMMLSRGMGPGEYNPSNVHKVCILYLFVDSILHFSNKMLQSKIRKLVLPITPYHITG